MAVRQYIGARYVPEFANPLEWNKETAYEPLTIVYNAGNSYTSRQTVPAGIDITNNDFWALTGNYNAQIEQYRNEVATFDGRITANADAISAETTARENAVSAETTAREQADNEISEKVTQNTDTLKQITKKKTLLVFGDSWASDAVANTWMGIYANIRHLNYKTYAVNGAGFVASATPENLISAQVQIAKDDSAINKEDVIEIIVVGGVNDYRNNAAGNTAGSEVVNVMNDLMEMYPNAECKYYLNGYYYGYSTDWLGNFLPNAFNDAFFSSTALMHGLLFNEYAFSSDLLHPTMATGQNVIVKELLCKSGLGNVEISNKPTFTSSDENVSANIINLWRIPYGLKIRVTITVNGKYSGQPTISLPDKYANIINRKESVFDWFGDAGNNFALGFGSNDGELVIPASVTNSTYYVDILTIKPY